MKEQEIIITTGIPCSGKSTWSKQYVKDNPTYVRVNRDELRRMRGIYWLVSQEDMITENELDCINNALVAGYNVVIDATNFNPKTIKKFEDLIAERTQKCHGEIKFKITYKHFDINLDEAISRDMGRPKEEQVGAAVITSMYNKYIVAKKIVEIEEGKTKLEQNYSLEKIYIFDIDGTVSLMNGRGAFEYHKVDTDSPNEPVISILKDYLIPSGIRILYLSGREDVCLEKTKLWLHKQGILSKYDVDILNGTNVGQFGLFMRKTGDNRDDRIVKKEMFDNYIKDKYYVKAVYDDRPKVIRMWRELGLFVFDVGDGHEF